MKIGYARVSSKDQNEARQIDALKAAGCEKIFVDKISGKDFNRPEYERMKEFAREGDVLYVEALDRFGRNKAQILQEWQDLTVRKGVDIVVLNMPLLDTTKFKEMDGVQTLIRDLVLQILSWLAEDERNRIRERQREGIDAAKRRGVKIGRKPVPIPENFPEYYRKWKDGFITATRAMQELGLKRTTYYKIVKQYEAHLQERQIHKVMGNAGADRQAPYSGKKG